MTITEANKEEIAYHINGLPATMTGLYDFYVCYERREIRLAWGVPDYLAAVLAQIEKEVGDATEIIATGTQAVRHDLDQIELAVQRNQHASDRLGSGAARIQEGLTRRGAALAQLNAAENALHSFLTDRQEVGA